MWLRWQVYPLPPYPEPAKIILLSSEETKERVRKAMIELGYEPNFQASNLASQNSRTIGIILPASAKEVYENSFYLEAVQGISITVTAGSI